MTTNSEGWAAIDKEPLSVWPPHDRWHGPEGNSRDVFRAQLQEALCGVELGAYDHRMVEWLAGWDTPTVAVVVSLLHRVREAGAAR